MRGQGSSSSAVAVAWAAQYQRMPIARFRRDAFLRAASRWKRRQTCCFCFRFAGFALALDEQAAGGFWLRCEPHLPSSAAVALRCEPHGHLLRRQRCLLETEEGCDAICFVTGGFKEGGSYLCSAVAASAKTRPAPKRGQGGRIPSCFRSS